MFAGLRARFMNEIESSVHDRVKINNQPAIMKINNQQNNGSENKGLYRYNEKYL